jgi:hypothetical protein
LVLTLLPVTQQAFAVNPLCLKAPPLTITASEVIRVANAAQLYFAVANAPAGSVILLAPGEYILSNSLIVRQNDLALIGDSDRCDAVVLRGKGMDDPSVTHGIWTDASSLSVRNLTIRDVYSHGIALNDGSKSPHIYNVQLLDTGEQFIKGNMGAGGGTDNGVVEYSVMAYTLAPPSTDHGGGTGYTNGIDIHGGNNWTIRNNLFANLHTPDTADHLYNPAILVWRGARNTLTENNVFINCDRAIAYGLEDDNANGHSHTGGVIRNNMIYQSPGLYSRSRKKSSDGAIIVWDSPQTKVLHNTALLNGNLPKFIEFRWDTHNAEVRNNLSDSIISTRTGGTFISSGNIESASESLFVDAAVGNLRLVASEEALKVPVLIDAPKDIDGDIRDGQVTEAGADALVIEPQFLPASNVWISSPY